LREATQEKFQCLPRFVFAAFLSFIELIFCLSIGFASFTGAVVTGLSVALCPLVFCSACFFISILWWQAVYRYPHCASGSLLGFPGKTIQYFIPCSLVSWTLPLSYFPGSKLTLFMPRFSVLFRSIPFGIPTPLSVYDNGVIWTWLVELDGYCPGSFTGKCIFTLVRYRFIHNLDHDGSRCLHRTDGIGLKNHICGTFVYWIGIKKASTSFSMFEWNFTFGKVMWTAQLLFDHCHDTGRFWLPCNALMQSWSFMYCVGSSINVDMTWMSFFTRRRTSCNPTSTGKNWKKVYASGNGVMTKNVTAESEGLVLPGHVWVLLWHPSDDSLGYMMQ